MLSILSFFEKLSTGAITAIIGLTVIFIVLFVLIIYFDLMGKLFDRTKSEEVPVQNELIEDDSEVVAAIMGALSAFYATEQKYERVPRISFKIKTIKQI